MQKSHSSSEPIQSKPAKPNAEFPLFAHASGRWAKKIRGRMVYFGKWADGPDAALERYNEQKEDLHAGRTPARVSAGVTVNDIVTAFLKAKLARVESGERSPRTFQDYKDAAHEVVALFKKRRLVGDLRAADFEKLRAHLASKWGFHRLGKTIQCVRTMFGWAFESQLIESSVRFGPGFKKPDKQTMRKHGHTDNVEAKVFTAAEIHKLLAVASPQLKAMVLLALNCGYGNGDCAALPQSALDLEHGWATFARVKTGVPRRAKLWKETCDALREALAHRPAPKDDAHANLVFLTRTGQPWTKAEMVNDGKEVTVNADNAVAKEMKKLLVKAGVQVQHRGFMH